MLYNLIVDDCGIDRHEHEPFVMPFYTAIHTTPKEAEDAIRRAVGKFLKSPEGVKERRHNCGYFNWGDVTCNVPDHYYIAEGLFPIPMKEEMSSVVMKDEDLIEAEDEYLLQTSVNIHLTMEDVATLIEKAVRSHNGSRYTFAVTGCNDEDLSDHIWDELNCGHDIDLYENENDELKHAMSVADFLNGFKRWHENGFDSCHAVKADGSVDVDNISAEEADRILRFALLCVEEALK